MNQANLTRSRTVAAMAAPPTQPAAGAAPSSAAIVLSPRAATGQLTTGFLFASPTIQAGGQPVPITVWKQETASGFWFPLLVVPLADAWIGEWITVCDVNATPLYFQIPDTDGGQLISVEEFGSSPG